MPKEKPELSDAMRKKMSGKPHDKNPIDIHWISYLFIGSSF